MELMPVGSGDLFGLIFVVVVFMTQINQVSQVVKLVGKWRLHNLLVNYCWI